MVVVVTRRTVPTQVPCSRLPGAHRRLGITSAEEHVRVKTIYKHSGFTKENLKHDIAVIELKGSAKISNKVSTVCLPTMPPKPGTKCYVTGQV